MPRPKPSRNTPSEWDDAEFDVDFRDLRHRRQVHVDSERGSAAIAAIKGSGNLSRNASNQARGGIRFTHVFPSDGEYHFNVPEEELPSTWACIRAGRRRPRRS